MKASTRWASAFALLSLTCAVLALYVDGQFPGAMGPTPFAFNHELAEALQAVDSRGLVDMKKLAAHRVALDSYVNNLASSTTEHFASNEEGTAFWLNAAHALMLQTLLDGGGWWKSWPVGGSRLTRWSLERHHLRETGDPRVALALCDGTRGGPRLGEAPFDAVVLDAQLTDAVRRFIRRADVVHLAGKTVELSPRLMEHELELLSALPANNRNTVLQFVWAFLPDSCEGQRPGCETRAALDLACGRALDGCTLKVMPRDESSVAR